MRFEKLRLAGFKSFVEATEFEIRPGLTGIVGPNGCGKSNLVEALRWVMGETSYKSMRGSGMEDVIFAGGGSRPARAMAEVVLTLDNSARTAPAPFNDAETLEVARRIGRDVGSTYRINGREVRARDVQMLFADASSGPRSPALVRQGQIAEIIAAKPQARRRILEEAAGIAGLHGRRQEAEFRLKGAAENLVRIQDILAQITAHSDALRRQARQATRYRELQAAIRQARALQTLIEWEVADQDGRSAALDLAVAVDDVAAAQRVQGETARDQAQAALALPALRVAESDAGVDLQGHVAALRALDDEERRARARLFEVERRLTDMEGDIVRDRAALDDAEAALTRLDEEGRQLVKSASSDGTVAALRNAVDRSEIDRLDAEARLAVAQTECADAEARRRGLVERGRETAARLARLDRDLASLAQALAAANAAAPSNTVLDAAAEHSIVAEKTAIAAQAASDAASAAVAIARADEASTRAPLAVADQALQRLETELLTLSKLLGSAGAGRWPPIMAGLRVEAGWEKALGAALGDNLDASSDARAPAHWIENEAEGDPALPAGTASLLAHVAAPGALRRHLSQIGLVAKHEGGALRRLLRPGQSLVSRDGDVWRWDGYTRAAELPAPAAFRLAEANRVGELRHAVDGARSAKARRYAAARQAETDLAAKLQAETVARDRARATRREAEAARHERDTLARRAESARTTLVLAAERVETTKLERDATARQDADFAAALSTSASVEALVAAVDAARQDAAAHGAAELRARATLEALRRDDDLREKRRGAIAIERDAWKRRMERSATHLTELGRRIAADEVERDALHAAPDRFVVARSRLQADVEQAETTLRAAGERRAGGEAGVAAADRAARESLDRVAAVREARARCEAKQEATLLRIEDLARTIADEFGCTPADLAAAAGTASNGARPSTESLAARLDGLKADRDRLGAVNLRAEAELAEADTRLEDLAMQKRDLDEAIRRLRHAIAGLNKEGRERLLGAFATVDGHFKTLFTGLFGGGEAELQLVEADDPLEAGLEIMARPPGKRPQVMSLLSGGEQALTAISLIFAVFLTNPSPICVLDEVDAPLDDANVERLCDLLDDVSGRTDTRFIVITHNPITMARMDRLYGVTQVERGISTLVSVDLAEAEALVDTA